MLIATKPKHQALNSAAEKLQLKIRGGDLYVVNKTKYLGVHIDNSLDWKERIKVVSIKVSRAIRFLTLLLPGGGHLVPAAQII